jgi:hypothetical protein
MKIEIKVVRLDGTNHVRRLRTPPHTRLTSAGVDALLHQEAERVEQYFPGAEFRLVPLRNGSFNFVEMTPEEIEFVGRRMAEKFEEIKEAETAALHAKHGEPKGILGSLEAVAQ